MEKATMFRGTGIVLAVGIVLMLTGVILPNEWAIERLCREVGVVVTFMGMVAMVAEHQGASDSQRRLLSTGQPQAEHDESTARGSIRRVDAA